MSLTPLFTTPPLPTKPPSTASCYHFAPPEKLAVLIDNSKSIHHVLQIHAALLRHNVLPHHHPVLNVKLLRSYSSTGRLRYSVSLFHQTEDPNVFLFTAIINSYSLHGLHDRALSFFVQMLSRGVAPTEFTFSSVLKSCSLENGKMIHSQVVKSGFGSDPYVRTGLVDAYARGGEVVSAQKMFDEMPERSLVSYTSMVTCYAKHGEIKAARALFNEMKDKDVVCWNVMIDGYAQHGFPTEALMLFRRMLASNVKPNEVTFLAVLSACGQVGALESGKWLHAYIGNHGMRISVHVGTALIDMYSKCGSPENAQLVFDKMTERDVVAYNAMIVGYAMHGFSQKALNLFDQMLKMDLHPTNITFIGLLNACVHAGLVNEGWRLLRAMKHEFKIEPKIEHYGCMVNLLARAGHLEEAYKLIKNMKIKSDPVLWGSLLGACRIHGNLALGKNIVEYLVTQDLANSGTYVLLSNMYSAVGDWDEASKIRSLMKEKGVPKEPGCSTIEVGNKVHEFLAGDRKHSKSREIYMMLEEVNSWLQAYGYAPKIDVVLHDIGDMEKEQALEVHSEKLALAFGLISTTPGTTLKVVKNLRVCLDCHAVFKLISKITGRKIVMRDRNLFHHFVDGSCSCGDYW